MLNSRTSRKSRSFSPKSRSNRSSHKQTKPYDAPTPTSTPASTPTSTPTSSPASTKRIKQTSSLGETIIETSVGIVISHNIIGENAHTIYHEESTSH